MTKVTPCVGVWIETPEAGTWSYPDQVTPCVGVWIETYIITYCNLHTYVTPCVGVWIETGKDIAYRYSQLSHPAWVCGLKL